MCLLFAFQTVWCVMTWRVCRLNLQLLQKGRTCKNYGSFFETDFQSYVGCSDKKLTFWHRSFRFNSNKSPTWCNNFSVYYPDVCLQLNMFRAFCRPSSGAQWLQWQPLLFPAYRGDSRAVFVVRPDGSTTNTARLSPQYEGKTRGCHCSHWAPYDGRQNARNMLSCNQTSG
jgi:hypothetical protein